MMIYEIYALYVHFVLGCVYIMSTICLSVNILSNFECMWSWFNKGLISFWLHD